MKASKAVAKLEDLASFLCHMHICQHPRFHILSSTACTNGLKGSLLTSHCIDFAMPPRSLRISVAELE